jgi:virginiamycin B lyase
MAAMAALGGPIVGCGAAAERTPERTPERAAERAAGAARPVVGLPAAVVQGWPRTGSRIAEMKTVTTPSGPSVVAVAPDQTVWVALAKAGKIARVTEDGVTEIALPRDSFPVGIHAEGGGVVWFSDIRRNTISRLDTNTGAIRDYAVPTPNAWPFQIARAADGRFYFTERMGNRIGRLDPTTGAIDEFVVPTEHAQPAGLAITPNGDVWFTENSKNQIGVLSPGTGKIVEHKVPSPAAPGPYYGPAGIAATPDGDVWFAQLDGRLGVIRSGNPGRIEEIVLPNPAVRPGGITVDAWGLVWFTGLDGNEIGSYDPKHRIFREYAIPSGRADPRPLSPPEATARGELPKAGFQARSTRPFGIAVDSAGRVWFSEQYGHRIGILYPPAIDIVEPSGAVWGVDAPLSIQTRAFGPALKTRYRLDSRPLGAEGTIDVATLAPGSHELLVEGTYGGETFRANSTFVVNPTWDIFERLVEQLDGSREADGATRSMLHDRIRAARAHIAAGRTDLSREEARKMLELVARSEGAPDAAERPLTAALARHLRYFDLFAPREYTVEVTGESGACAPGDITIEAGDTVVWRRDPAARAAVRLLAADGSFRSPVLGPGARFRQTFTREGHVPYSCAAPGEARASVRVTPRTTAVERYPMLGPGRVPGVLHLDDAHNVWFTAGGGGYAGLSDIPVNNRIGKLSPAGELTEYVTPTPGSAPTSIAVAKDGSVWFTERAASRIARLDPKTGAITELPTPTPDSGPTGIAVADDGIVWFTEKRAGKIGRYDPAKDQFDEIATPNPQSEPSTVVVDGAGFVWFDERAADNIVRLDPRTRTMTQFKVPTRNSRVIGLLPDPRGLLWFLELGAHKIGRLDVESGQIVEYQIPTHLASPFKAALDRHGRLWFTEAYGDKIGVLHEGRFFEFALPKQTMPGGIKIDDNGDVWFAEQAGNALGVLRKAASVLAPAGP